MYRIILIILCFYYTSAYANSTSRYIENMLWMTEDYPPFNYKDENQQLTGFAVDLLMEMFRRNQVKLPAQNIMVYPWARAYKIVQQQKDSVLFTMDHTESRAKLFKFVGPIATSRVSIFTLSQEESILSLTQLDNKTVGVVRDDIGEQLLDSLGARPKKKISLPTSYDMMRMLKMGRVDAIALAEDIARFQLHRIGLTPDDYRVHMVLHSSFSHYAFNKQVPDEVINQLQVTLDKIRQEGFIKKLHFKYLPGNQ